MRKNIISFNTKIGKSKPETIIDKDAQCPFCEYDHLEHIIDTCGEMTLLENKYNVLENSFQTVLLETRYCGSDMPDYSDEHMRMLIRFGIRHWFSMLDSGKYKSVLFFKNYGPLSGGTMRHPHMQIIGLKNVDNSLLCEESDFLGTQIAKKGSVELNISTFPRLGFCELNVLTENNDETDTIADFIKISVDYIMNHFNKRCKSYNIFFYRTEGLIKVKIMPRFPTSPLFIGYSLRLRPNNLNIIVNEMRKLYFSHI
ncbi:DUF4931 domain-containing protein [Pectinatus haikarae]|uniref:Galactose-1-phosphate uridylyltransferase n=1 Tax=Pectinatus haikarae TaxID=349096 RepID=A0ABT9Y8C8_9FIRM|nr:DUF4931 domain-containing protein [Pectinatus haikarae]MDQ0203893.1 galactose-1-phosphate uridylyltransferase [Pectinatus haikarae]